MIDITLYRGARDARPIARERLTWPELVAELVDALAVEAPKLAMLAWSPVRLRDACACGRDGCDGGPHRLLANVEHVSALVIDVDRGDPDTVREALTYAGWSALAYESPSSTDAAPRFRVVAPTSRDMTIDECARARFAFAEALGLAPGCGVEGAKDAAKIFFAGRTPRSRERAHYTTEGAPVDVDALLSMPLAHVRHSSSAAASTSVSNGQSADADMARAHALARALPPSVSGHGGDEALMVAARELATVLGPDPTTIYAVLVETYNPRAVPPWPVAKLEREARRAAELAGAPVARALARARERAAADDTTWAHAPEVAPADGAPVLLRSRDGNVVWLWEGDERGLHAIAKDVLRARVRELGLEAIVPLREGKRARSASAILDDATTYKHTRYDYAATRTAYDAAGDGTVTCGYALPAIVGAFDAAVDTWLRALAGAQYERLEAWIASCAQQHIGRLAAAVVLIGPADVGKSLFACACAGLWGELVPPALRLVTERFNGDMLRCPVLVDEEAQLMGSRAFSTKAFRDLTQRTEHSIEKKGQERTLVRGTVRQIVPCNGLEDLRFTDVTGADVVEAVSDRTLLVDARMHGEACRAALARLRLPGAWEVDRARVVAHFAWLAETVALPAERFVGGGSGTAAVLAGHVACSPELWARLAAWLDMDAHERGPWYVHAGRLAVDPVALALELAGVHGWPLERVHGALMPFRAGRVQPRVAGRRVRLWTLDADALATGGAVDVDGARALAARLHPITARAEIQP